MTLLEAVALATLGASHRRYLAVTLRILTDRSTAEDADLVPTRAVGESLIQWACRARYRQYDQDALNREVTAVLDSAARQLRNAAARDIVPVPLGDARYPLQLAAIADPPPVLWVRGNPAVLSEQSVALVGSRAASTHGLAVAREIAADLTRANITTVSGLARGIDSAAHVATIRVGGKTIAVLGSGPDRIYPSEHRELAAEIAERGAVVSEFPPGTPPLAHHFPLRNRIISGLSNGIVVVEAPEKSGALITAVAALEQGREVMVVPGAAQDGRNRGGHLLIRDGAKIVETAVDILQELGLPGSGPDCLAPALVGSRGSLGDASSLGFTVDEVAERTGQPANVVLARLLELELAGKIQRIGGGRFARPQDRVLT